MSISDSPLKEEQSVDAENVASRSIWEQLMLGDTRAIQQQSLQREQRHSQRGSTPSIIESRYKDYPLVHSMIQYEVERTEALQREGRAQRDYPGSNEGWLVTLFMVRGRALDRFCIPWVLVTLHAIIYTVVQELVYSGSIGHDGDEMVLQSWEVFFSFVLNPTLSFLLVFRLQRAADRYWSARFYWGDIVAKARTLVSTVVVHGRGDDCNHVVRWMVAYSVAIMEFLRGEKHYNGNMLAGVLIQTEMQKLEGSLHPPLYAMTKLRFHLREAFCTTPDMPLPTAMEQTQTLHRLELQLNIIQDCCGGMERIKATPLPIVYVSHLRTFLIVTLLLFPYVYGPSWRWTTIPLVFLAGFAWLGIDGAAEECESPFDVRSVNALDMDSYCIGLMGTILQEIQNQADEERGTLARQSKA